jgi:N-acetylgalactosamine-6-sulfatase
MVTCMDAGVGRIVDRLRELGIDDDTLVLFTSDNGPSYQGSPGPWTGAKGDLHEGGIRVPMIARWPGRITPGTVAHEPGHTNDLLPTFADAAGAALPDGVRFDGVSLVPRLDGGKVPERDLFWQMDLYEWYPQPGDKPRPYATEVMQRGDWKLLAVGGEPTGLYDLAADPAERANALAEQRAVVEAMIPALRAWLEEARP